MFQGLNDPCHTSNQSSQGDNEGEQTEGLEEPVLPPRHFHLPNVHLNRVVDCERPKAHSPKNAQHRVEEGNHHWDNGGDDHVHSSPHETECIELEAPQSWQPHGVFLVEEFVPGPPLGAVELHKSIHRLCVDLKSMKINVLNLIWKDKQLPTLISCGQERCSK